MTVSDQTRPSPHREIAVTVVGGYLGSGKTTLVNHVLREADSRLAVIVNDFGDINIDADLIVGADDATISLANGCICCSLVDGFAAALATIRDLEPAPERLLIEASGVALPQQVAAWAHGPGFSLDAVVVVVDVETVRRTAEDRYVGDTVVGQLRAADVLIVNKIDLVEPSDAAQTLSWLSKLNPTAFVLTATQAAVDPMALFALPRPVLSGSAVPHAERSKAASPEVSPQFSSRTISLDGPVSRNDVDRLMEALPPSVVRVKGWLRLSERPEQLILLQRAGSRWTLVRAEGGLDEQLVFIATDEAALARLAL